MLMSPGARPAPPLKILVESDADAFDPDAASADEAHAFLRARWFRASAPERLALITARRQDGAPVAGLPIIPRSRLFDVARIGGGYWPFRSFPVARDAGDEDVSAMLRHPEVRAALGPVWRVGPIFEDDPTLARLTRAAPRAGWTMLRRPLGTCFEIDVAALRVDGPWPRASTLKKNRWREKCLREEGELAIRRSWGNDWRGEDLDAVALIESRCWLAKLEGAADSQARDPRQRRFWEEVARDPVLAPMLFCTILTVGGTPAAFSFGMEVGKVRYQIANNYDPRFARHSPGRFLLIREFEGAAGRGIERISWGSGDAGYKSEMGAQPGPAILDLLFVRPALLALPLRRLWTGSFRA